ncbi:MAG: hypothetical protein GY938_13385 [Ketobacter sp.]|nr:hypothetical protein [Ketobacter sp.]
MNGRPGQQQDGIDIYVRDKSGRIGIQCKRYMDGRLTLKKVISEVEAAEKAGSPIVKLIVATTSENDAKLLRSVQDLSDTREDAGKFPVEVEFWGDICRHIRKHPKLSQDYAPNEPGGVFYDIKETLLQVAHFQIEQSKSQASMGLSLPEALPSSINQFVTRQLDSVNDLITQGLYNDAYLRLTELGLDLEPFDEHQKARWYLQRGTCSWHQRDLPAAARDLHISADLYPDHEKMAAARVRAYLLQNDGGKALDKALECLERFPSSAAVWVVYLNSRLVQGHNVELSEVPKELRDHEDILQILAWVKLSNDNPGQALNLIMKALKGEGASFYTRRAALAIALQLATSNPVRTGYHFIPKTYLNAVSEAVDSLEPLDEKLWINQSIHLVAETIDNLGLAYLVLNKPDIALELVRSAEAKNLLSPMLMRVALTAYADQEELESFIQYAEKWIEELDESALLQAAETAGNEGQIQLITKISERLSSIPDVSPESIDIITALKWIATWKQPDTSEAILSEIKAIECNDLNSVYRVCGAAAVLHFAGELQLRDQALNRAVELTNERGSDQECVLIADLLFAAGDFVTASRYYKRFTEDGYISRLHTHLLACYVRSGNWKLAKKMFSKFPKDWASNQDLRSLAYELSEKAGDLDFLEKISEAEWEANPLSCGSWLMRLSVLMRMKRMFRFHDLLQQLPMELTGSHRQIAQIADLEIKYDQCEQGMHRIYQLYRGNLDSIDAATGYFIAIINNSNIHLPYMDEALPTVQPGTTITLEADEGDSIVFTIDPDGVSGLPERDSFYSSSSIEVASLIGREQGETISMPSPLGIDREFKVKNITSAFRYLIHLAQSKFKSSLSQNQSVTSIKVIKENGEADFTQITQAAKARHEHSQNVLQTYATSPLTLGAVSSILGLSPIDLVIGWPAEGAPLLVSSGNRSEIKLALRAAETLDRCYVIDSITIAELVYLDCSAALTMFSNLICSTHTLMLLEQAHKEALEGCSMGTLSYQSGSLGMMEYQIKNKEKRIELLARMVEETKTHCRVIPGYGSTAIPTDLMMYQEVLSSEEFSALLLVDEYDGCLITLDGRLAHIYREIFTKDNLWPQVLLEKAVAERCITIRTYRYAILRELCWNRSFVSITKHEIELLLYQPYAIVQFGVTKLKHYLSDSRVDPLLSQTVIFDFLELMAVRNITFDAYYEIVEHMLDALRGHPQVNLALLFLRVNALVHVITHPGNYNNMMEKDTPFHIWSSIQHRSSIRGLFLHRLDAYIKAARESEELPRITRPLRIKSLLHTDPPTVVYDENCGHYQGNDVEMKA